MTDLSNLLAAAQARWMIGGAPAPCEHPLTAGQPAVEADLRLLAVAGQFLRLGQTPQAPRLQARPDLPPLSLPFLPDALRPQLRRLLAARTDPATPEALAHLAARRGFALHPVDWLPKANADLPTVYAPLLAWITGAAPADLQPQTWLDMPAPERLRRFAALRLADPAQALTLLADRFASCPAEERLDLLQVLARGLGPADMAFLQGIEADRSDKVRRLARQLLARLGRVTDDPATAEAAALFEQATTGLIFRKKVLRLNPKAKEGQVRSLVALLPSLTLHGLALAIGLTPDTFVQLWQADSAPEPVALALTELVAASANDADLATFWAGMRDTSAQAAALLPQLYPRLPPPDRQAALLWLIGQSGLDAAGTVLVLAGPNAPAPVSAALAAHRGRLVDLLQVGTEPAARQAALGLARFASLLGLVLTAKDAALTMTTLVDAGVHPADPLLTLLNFNAALKG